MPAGYGTRCSRCYWRDLLEKRIQLDCAAFSSRMIAKHFTAFGEWLLAQVGEQKSAITIHRYLPFFSEIEQQWEDIPEYNILLAHFGTARLRQALLPMRWMETVGLVIPDESAKAENSEYHRITTTQGRFPPLSNKRILLDGYLQVLYIRLKEGKITLSSVRLALTPAAGLLDSISEDAQTLPNQKNLENYLTKKPGQRAAISGFVQYLHKVHHAKLRLPEKNPAQAKQLRRKKLGTELLLLMKNGDNNETCKRKWISVALAYFHGLNKNIGRKIPIFELTQIDDGLVISWSNMDYWLPIPTWWPLK